MKTATWLTVSSITTWRTCTTIRNNPFSGCDFAGNTGCPSTGTPFLSDVTPPYDYVPASDAAYQARLNDISLQIINDLHSPDILMVQEVENQDICSVTDGALVCDTTTDNPDGKPDVLQELALKIASNGGPTYDAACDRHSSDLRGIAPAFLYRTDRVQLVDPAGDPVLGTNPALSYPGAAVPYDGDIVNPKTLNAVLPATFAAAETAKPIGSSRARRMSDSSASTAPASASAVTVTSM